METSHESSLKESSSTLAWLMWCKSRKDVKCIEYSVPLGILPKSYKGILIDVKIQAKGPDDKTYSANKDLRDKVARGNCVLELQKLGENVGTLSETRYIFMIFALKKFSGGMGDEDDDPGCQNMWQNYFIKPLSNATRIISTVKANGEAAHISSRKLFNENFYCIGSKNVHMLVRDIDDIQKYSDSRFLVARPIAETFFRTLENNNSKKMELVNYLQKTKYTMVNEILQPSYQHVENLSHLKCPELRFICWTGYEILDDPDNLCALPPNLGIDQAKYLGLETVNYEIMDASQADQHMAKIRSEFGYEGRVLYFLDNYDRTIGVLKKKTAWYVILRSIREKLCHFCSKNSKVKNASERYSKVSKRLVEIQSWIGFSDPYRKNWTELGSAFVEWVWHLIKKVPSRSSEIRSQFPIFWEQFLSTEEKWMNMYRQLETNYS